MSDSDPSRVGGADDDSRVEALRRARRRRPWTDELVAECAADSAAFKERIPVCAACPQPCEADEVCATAVAKSGDLFESMSREQAFHLIENGMKRLRTRGEARLRIADGERPNTFLALNDVDTVESRDERRTTSPNQQ
jgi:hypothetical protein